METTESLGLWKFPKYGFVSEGTEISFPIIPSTVSTTSGATKINIIVSSIPLETARIMNLTFLSFGASLNLFIILVIACNSTLHTAMNLHVISLACSNMVLLIEPLEEVLRWFFEIEMKLNMDYVCMINFDVSVTTMAILKLLLYANIFERHTPFGHRLLKNTTALKGILLVWTACTISLAIGLHIYDFFEGEMADIYVWITIMYIVMPLIIFLALDSLILYELIIVKMVHGIWRTRELRSYVMLVIIATAFYLIRMPYRLARAINFIEPKASCCTDSKREILYFMAKTFPIVFPIIYIALSNEFRQAFLDMVTCRRGKAHTEIVVA